MSFWISTLPPIISLFFFNSLQSNKNYSLTNNSHELSEKNIRIDIRAEALLSSLIGQRWNISIHNFILFFRLPIFVLSAIAHYAFTTKSFRGKFVIFPTFENQINFRIVWQKKYPRWVISDDGRDDGKINHFAGHCQYYWLTLRLLKKNNVKLPILLAINAKLKVLQLKVIFFKHPCSVGEPKVDFWAEPFLPPPHIVSKWAANLFYPKLMSCTIVIMFTQKIDRLFGETELVRPRVTNGKW